ncbi:hypothetical protein Tco_1201006 [Tanacetum coccineum]
MKNKMMYKGDNVVGALMNVPIFVGTFSVMTDFAVLEDMDTYRDERMGDVILGEPFLREDPITFEMQRWKNGSHVGTLACMSWSEVEAEEKSNLKTSLYQDRNALVLPIFHTGPRERNIDEYWWRIYESGNLEVLES